MSETHKSNYNWQKLVITVLVTILTVYNFMLFVFLTPKISPLFFPVGNYMLSVIAGLGIYAIGFFARPIGGVIFGHMSDFFGRTRAVQSCATVMALTSILICMMPSYNHIGFIAPASIILLSLLQGGCYGGMYGSISLMAIESSSKNKGTLGAVITASTGAGCLLASAIAAIADLQFMPDWAWRVTFLLGALVGILGKYLPDSTPRIDNDVNINKMNKIFPLMTILRNYPFSLFRAFCISAFAGLIFNFTFVYMPIYLSTVSGWLLSDAMLLNSLGFVFYIILTPLSGFLADRYGTMAMIKTSLIPLVVSVLLLLHLLVYSSDFYIIFFVQTIFAIITAWIHGPTAAFMANLFPIEVRGSGVSIGYSLGMGLGGTTPLILAYGITWGNDYYTLLSYLLFGTAIGLLAIYPSGKTEAYFSIKQVKDPIP